MGLWDNIPITPHHVGKSYSDSDFKDRSWNNGQLALGEVIKVHHKRYTADVRIIKTQDTYTSPDNVEGRYACQIGVSLAGFNDTYQMPYGEILPIYVGDIVLVAFLNNTADKPIILRVFHDITEDVGDPNYRNILPNSDNENTSDSITDYLKIMPIQDYVKIKENGDFEKVSHTKSFIVGTEEEINTETFDFEDLSVKFPTDKTVINPNAGVSTAYDPYTSGLTSNDISGEVKTVHVKETYSKPKTYLAVFRDKFNDTVTNWLRFIIDAARTSFRLVQAKRNFKGSEKGASTSITLDSEGSIVIKRQLDTMSSDSEFSNELSKQYSEITMSSDGGITIETVDKSSGSASDYPRTVIQLYPKGGAMSIYTTSKLSVNAKNGINFASDENIKIDSKKVVSITSKQGTQIVSDQNIVVNSKTDAVIKANSAVTTQASTVVTSGSRESYGSHRDVGATQKIGSEKVIGSMSVNSHSLVARGDRDTHGYSNYAMKSNRTVAALQSFVMDVAINLLSQEIPEAAALAGLIQMGSGLYSNFEGMSFNDKSTNIPGVASGTIIGEGSPFFSQLSTFANATGIDLTSVSGQMDFMTASIAEGGLGIVLDGAQFEGMTPFEKTLAQATVLWDTFGKINTLSNQMDTCYSKSSEVTLSDDEKKSMSEGCQLVSCEIQPTMFNPDISTSDLADDPKDMKPIGSFPQENQVVIDSGDATQGQDVRKHIVTIEDALDSIAPYVYPNGWQAEVKKISEKVDAEQGTNSMQYYNVNRKQTFSPTQNGSGGLIYPEYTSKPAEVVTKDQYLDRTAKRYVYENAVKAVELANCSWKNYTIEQEVGGMHSMTSARIRQQEEQYKQVYG